MRKRIQQVWRNRHEEGGLAMATVIIISFTLSSFMIIVSSIAVSTLVRASDDEDWQAALNAANAGIDEYIARLNADGNYWIFGNPSDPFSAGSDVELPTGANTNTFFTQWTPVPGSNPNNPKRPETRYAVDTSEYLTTGLITLEASGRVGEQTRTIEALLRRRAFIDYLYFTDLETKDPALYSSREYPYWSPSTAQNRCSRYYYAGRDSRCTDINFAGRDEIRGPLHTNDAMLVCMWCGGGQGPYFRGDTSTSWDRAGVDPERFRRNSSGNNNANPTFARAGDPRYVPPLNLPPSNTTMKQQVDPAYTPTPGCLFTGPTRIDLDDDNNGRMRVYSPWTNNSQNPACGGGANTGWVNMPENGVIYVQNVPANPSTDPYVRNSPAYCYRTNCIGFPIRRDITSYSRQSGDAFVSGELNGLLTIAAEDDIIIWDDTIYDSGAGGDDMLGLIANNFVEVYHPVDSGGRDLLSTSHWGGNREPDIFAAMLSVSHSIRVQNYAEGNRLGDLNIYGALAQKYRGIVGIIGRSGYDKNYNYDARLKFQSPPHFLDPVQSGFGLARWTETERSF